MPAEHWAAYYRGGALVSCPTNPEPGYTGAVRETWERFFGALPKGARLLDAGTGNGPVALIAKEVSDENGLDLRITGVDLADIDPKSDVEDGAELFAGIDFRGNVSLMDLPFEAGSFEAISGQYILEYTDREKTLAECARVLTPGGRAEFMLHHADSIIVTNAVESLRQAELVTSDSRIISKVERFFDLARDPGANSESARQRMITAGKRLEAEAERSKNPLLLEFVLAVLTRLLENFRSMSAGEVLTELRRLERELSLWVLRLVDLTNAALTTEDVEAMIELARGVGFEVGNYDTVLQEETTLVGWRLALKRL